MNLPNKLTILRVILIPFFLVALMVDAIPYGKWIAVGIFVIASFTDMLDGKIARKYNLITNFGKFMDPLADKLLVCSAMIALIELDRIPAWVVIIIIAREFIISGFRLVASDNGVVIAAGWWGKVKTVVQMVMIIFIMCDFGGKLVGIVEDVLIYAALALTIISLIDYLVKNKGVLSDTK
ncbi:MAG: CDP-diacylglycerol--glycerol-3-phosphate 3-phosphatidyltransferase [Lachnospiraceae bacterium]|nr:CDP-diacylglycerol--glycerol-3-phosphate 3-phosphatidyltransferase [Lachnospiraceae bacterium]